jgi:hypothetical protein
MPADGPSHTRHFLHLFLRVDQPSQQPLGTLKGSIPSFDGSSMEILTRYKLRLIAPRPGMIGHLVSGQALFHTIEALKATEWGHKEGNSSFYQRSDPFEALHSGQEFHRYSTEVWTACNGFPVNEETAQADREHCV